MPAYTDEARAQRIEGEVILEVEFIADGRSACSACVRGLGFGLDEMAQPRRTNRFVSTGDQQGRAGRFPRQPDHSFSD